MIQIESQSLRRASIVEYPERNSLLILRAANGRVLREIIYPSDLPECWDVAYRALRREAAILGYEVRDDVHVRAHRAQVSNALSQLHSSCAAAS